MKTTHAIALALGVGVLVAASFGVAMMLGPGSTVDDPTDTETTNEQVEVDRLDVTKELGATVSSGTVYLIDSDKAPAAGHPEYYGDYVDFDATEATSGLQEGVDYYTASVSDSKAIDFTSVAPGEYTMVFEDESSTRVYHDNFVDTVNVPSSVARYKVEGGNTPTVYLDDVSFDQVETVDEDRTEVLDAGREVLSVGTDLGVDSNDSDQIRFVKRTIDLESGNAYLGDLTFDNVEFRSDGTVMEVVDVQTDGSSISDVSGTTLYDSDAGTDEIESDGKYSFQLGQSDSVESVGNEMSVLVRLEYDQGTGTITNDDGTVQDGEQVFDLSVEDIYQNALGDGIQSITG